MCVYILYVYPTKEKTKASRCSNPIRTRIRSRPCHLAPLHDVPHEFLLGAVPGRIEEEGVAEGPAVFVELLIKNRLLVCKAVECVFPVIASHAAVANATEGEVWVATVEEAAIDGDPARARILDDALRDALVAAEDIHAKRFGFPV